ncbi:hypothetical protein TIFTF001_009980 [Ficus carica]|uniref:Secreted protein n=1 Tax=Ficus carica TaxID=3494 RepID=A0AA88A7V2_FICCA|nr:hypothetical protein TIFTF001_009980 [Ficus carica]
MADVSLAFRGLVAFWLTKYAAFVSSARAELREMAWRRFVTLFLSGGCTFVPNSGELFVEVVVLVPDADGDIACISRSAI